MIRPEFACPASMQSHCASVFAGEYDVPGLTFARPPHVVDIGANLGAFSVWATKRWPGCTLLALEPHPENFKLLTKNVAQWPVADVRRCAVIGSYDTHLLGPGRTVKLRDGLPNCGCASLYDLGEQSAPAHDVPVMLARELPPCDVLKVDTEGAELEILTAYLDGSRPRAVMYEAHGEADRKELAALVRNLGYDDAGETQTIPNRWTVKWVKK